MVYLPIDRPRADNRNILNVPARDERLVAEELVVLGVAIVPARTIAGQGRHHRKSSGIRARKNRGGGLKKHGHVRREIERACEVDAIREDDGRVVRTFDVAIKNAGSHAVGHIRNAIICTMAVCCHVALSSLRSREGEDRGQGTPREEHVQFRNRHGLYVGSVFVFATVC
jgi:hypothetical protein